MKSRCRDIAVKASPQAEASTCRGPRAGCRVPGAARGSSSGHDEGLATGALVAVGSRAPFVEHYEYPIRLQLLDSRVQRGAVRSRYKYSGAGERYFRDLGDGRRAVSRT